MKSESYTTKDTGRKAELLMKKMEEFPDGIIMLHEGTPPFIEAKLEEKTIELYPTQDSKFLIFFTKMDGARKEAELRDGLMPYDLTNNCLRISYKGEIYNIHLNSSSES